MSTGKIPSKQLGARTGGATNVKITNFTIAATSTEYSHTLQNNLKQLRIRHRDKANIQYTFTVGESGTNYITVYGNTMEGIIDLDFSSKVLYFQADKTGVVEILELY